MKARQIAYWTTTLFVVFSLVSGAIGELAQQGGTLETVTILGYPAYFLTIIGLWKIAGSYDSARRPAPFCWMQPTSRFHRPFPRPKIGAIRGYTFFW